MALVALTSSPSSCLPQPTPITGGLTEKDAKLATLKYAHYNTGFATLQLSQQQMQLDFFNYEGHHLYHTRVDRPTPPR